MSKWVPGVALIGLVCVMLLPAPGIIGITIGGGCVLAIAASAFMLLMDKIAANVVDPLLASMRQSRAARQTKKQRRRAVHAGSGMARKA